MNSEETTRWLTSPDGLATKLRQMREAAGLSGVHLASQLGWDRTKPSKIENGRTMPTNGDILAWTEACGQAPQSGELIALLEQGVALHQLHKERLRKGHAGVQQDWDTWIREARTVVVFEMAALPGLLQTPEYARAMMSQAIRYYGATPEDVEAAIPARMHRQQALYGPGKFTFIMMETVLRTAPATPDVMVAQLGWIRHLAQLPNVTVAIVPQGKPLTFYPENPFNLVDDTEVRAPTFGGLVTVTGSEANSYVSAVPALLEESLTGDGADQLILAVIDWWQAQESPDRDDA